jgi:hypothetical protein
MVSPWTGRNIQNESTSPRRVTPNKQGAGCGQAAMSSRGYLEYAFGRAEVRSNAWTMPTLIGRRRVDPTVEARILELKASGDGILKIGRKLGIGTSVVQRVFKQEPRPS